MKNDILEILEEHHSIVTDELGQKLADALVEYVQLRQDLDSLGERNSVALDHYRGKTFSDSTDWEAQFDHFIKVNELKIKLLQDRIKARDTER